jgi:hypothetical protein
VVLAASVTIVSLHVRQAVAAPAISIAVEPAQTDIVTIQ